MKTKAIPGSDTTLEGTLDDKGCVWCDRGLGPGVRPLGLAPVSPWLRPLRPYPVDDLGAQILRDLDQQVDRRNVSRETFCAFSKNP